MRRIRNQILIYSLISVFAFIWGGCGLNPGKAYLEADTTQCTGCGECTAVCPVDAVRIISGKAVIDPAKCVICGKCTEACPVNAIQ